MGRINPQKMLDEELTDIFIRIKGLNEYELSERRKRLAKESVLRLERME